MQAGFLAVYTAQSCTEARRVVGDIRPEAILLDVMLPDGDGFSLLQELRQERDIPILFLSARDADADRLHGLGLGADDYIAKPFLPQELVLRLTAVLRRSYAANLQNAGECLSLGETVVDWGSGLVLRDANSTPLTAKEYALLRKLADNRGNIVTIDALCRAVRMRNPDRRTASRSSLTGLSVRRTDALLFPQKRVGQWRSVMLGQCSLTTVALLFGATACRKTCPGSIRRERSPPFPAGT